MHAAHWKAQVIPNGLQVELEQHEDMNMMMWGLPAPARTLYLGEGGGAEGPRAEEARPGEGGAKDANSHEPPPKCRHAVLLQGAGHGGLGPWGNHDQTIEESVSEGPHVASLITGTYVSSILL
jgi:hypothetical protein